MPHKKNGPTREGGAGCDRFGRRSQPDNTKKLGRAQLLQHPLWQRVFGERRGHEIDGEELCPSAGEAAASTYAAMQLYRLRDEIDAMRDDLAPGDAAAHLKLDAIKLRAGRALSAIGEHLPRKSALIAARGTAEALRVSKPARLDRLAA